MTKTWSGKRIKKLRSDISAIAGQEWTQEILSNALGVSVQTLASWERDMRDISPEKLTSLNLIERCLEDARYTWRFAPFASTVTDEPVIMRSRDNPDGQIVVQTCYIFKGFALVRESAIGWPIQYYEMLFGPERAALLVHCQMPDEVRQNVVLRS